MAVDSDDRAAAGATERANAALQALLSAEREHDLWHQRVLGYPVWPLLRLEHYRRNLLGGESVIADEPSARVSPLRALSDATRSILTQGLPRGDGRDIWVLSSSTYRRRTASGDLPCIFTAHLTEQLGARVRFIEVNPSGLPLSGRPDVFLLDPYLRYIHAVAEVASLAAPALPARGALSKTPMRELIQRAAYGQQLERLGRLLLRSGRPRAVFVLCAYGSMIPLQRAVRAAGIPLIELQHGVIHESHPGYVFDGSTPELDHRPDHLVLFGRHFGQLLDRHSPALPMPWSVGGHPWLRRARVSRPDATDRGRGPVVVFGQYDPPVQRQLATLVPALRAALPADIELIYKPHPREPITALAADLARAGVALAGASDDSYQLLSHCRASVTVYSTLAIEALAFGCHSIAVESPYWNDDIRRFAAQGLLRAAADADDIARIVGEPIERAADVANALFGVDEPEPDFEALLAEVTARKARAR